jgi:hypothetical protein
MESTLMKRLLFVAILATYASACVEGNNPLQLLGARPFETTDPCDRGTVDILRGTLNYNVNTHYRTTFSLFSPLTSGTAGASASSDSFIAQEILLSYEAKGVSVSFTDETLPIYFVVEGGSQAEGSWIGLDLIGDEARKKLDSVVPAAPDTMTLLVTVQLKGKLTSGKEVESNDVTFPIVITRGAACASGQTPGPAGEDICFPGQDGVAFSCG